MIHYIEENYANIEKDMNNRNSTSKNKGLSESAVSYSSTNSTSSYTTDMTDSIDIINDNGEMVGGAGSGSVDTNNKTRKKREELSISATKSIKKEKVEIVVNFNS